VPSLHACRSTLEDPLQATREQIDEHYPKDEAWIRRLGEKTLKNYQEYGFDAKKELGTEDPMEIGKLVRSWLIDYLTSGPMGTELEFVIMVIAVSCVKLLSAHNSTQHTSRKHKV
jgi:hypothetical protein